MIIGLRLYQNKYFFAQNETLFFRAVKLNFGSKFGTRVPSHAATLQS